MYFLNAEHFSGAAFLEGGGGEEKSLFRSEGGKGAAVLCSRGDEADAGMVCLIGRAMSDRSDGANRENPTEKEGAVQDERSRKKGTRKGFREFGKRRRAQKNKTVKGCERG